MGLFGGLSPKRQDIGDMLSLIGGWGQNLQDAANGVSGPSHIAEAQAMIAQRRLLAQKQAAQQQLMGLYGQPGAASADAPSVQSMVDGVMKGDPNAPTLPQVTARTPPAQLPSLSDPAVQRQLLAAQQSGIDIRPIVDMLKATQPNIKVAPDGSTYSDNDPRVLGKKFAVPTVVNGLITDLGDRNNLERYIPQLGEGMTYQRDAAGRPIGVQNAPGYIDALGQSTEAKQTGQTRGTMFKVPRQEGGEAMMTGGQYLTGGQSVPGLGVSQTPAEAAAANVRATSQAGAQVSLPQNLQMADQALSVIDQLKKDPAISSRTGMFGALPAIPGTPGADFDAKVAQLKGKLFMEAYAGLKGGGQITEVEGRKATEAIGRLNTTQTKAGFIAALDDLASVIQAGKQRAAAQAGASSPSRQSAPARPPRSAIEAEMRRRGLLK